MKENAASPQERDAPTRERRVKPSPKQTRCRTGSFSLNPTQNHLEEGPRWINFSGRTHPAPPTAGSGGISPNFEFDLRKYFSGLFYDSERIHVEC
jgi:hypothetical protein